LLLSLHAAVFFLNVMRRRSKKRHSLPPIADADAARLQLLLKLDEA